MTTSSWRIVLEKPESYVAMSLASCKFSKLFSPRTALTQVVFFDMTGMKKTSTSTIMNIETATNEVDLTAAIYHTGFSKESGHYITLVRSSSGSFHMFDDNGLMLGRFVVALSIPVCPHDFRRFNAIPIIFISYGSQYTPLLLFYRTKQNRTGCCLGCHDADNDHMVQCGECGEWWHYVCGELDNTSPTHLAGLQFSCPNPDLCNPKKKSKQKCWVLYVIFMAHFDTSVCELMKQSSSSALPSSL